MYRIFRPASLLACATALAIPVTAGAADYLIDNPVRIATTGIGFTDLPPANFDSVDAAIAVSPADQVALVVWASDDASVRQHDKEGFLADEEFEIQGRLVATDIFDAATDEFRISTMGNDAETDTGERQRYDALHPAAAWNPVASEFLVVWEGDDDTAPLVDGEFEIFGQRVNAEGELVGDRFRISAMGDDAATDPAARQRFAAARPAVAVNTVTGEYLVTWQGDTDAAPLVDDEVEIFGRMLGADGAPLASQFRVSTAGSEADTGAARTAYAAEAPAVIFNPEGYFVVAWQADGNESGLVDDAHEIFAAEVAADGSVGAPLMVSNMGPAGDASFDALAPALAVDPGTGTMLVAWHGDTASGSLVENEFEVHGRVLNFDMVPAGDQVRISVMGSDTETDAAKREQFAATDAAAAWSANDGMFLVAWTGDTVKAPLIDEELEVHARFVRAGGTLPHGSFRISTQGDDEEETAAERRKYEAMNPALAYASGAFLLAWHGDTQGDGAADDQLQVFAARAAESFTVLELGYASDLVKPVVPEPIRVDYIIANTTDEPAENVTVRISMTNEFPLTLIGCDNIVDETVCELGDIPGNGEATFSISLATDHIEMGGEQSTTVTATVNSDTTLSRPLLAVRKTFVGATLVVEGGSGALGGFWFALAGIALLARIVRRRD